MSGTDDIAAERKRQIEEEGWTPEHDDSHRDGDLARAASAYAFASILTDQQRHSVLGNVNPAFFNLCWMLWPLNWSWATFKPKDKKKCLVKAGALIAAEIDRLDRLSQRGAA